MTTTTGGARLTRVVFDDEITRAFVLATVVWGIVALALGALIASQLTWWQANFHTEWLTFGFDDPKAFETTAYLQWENLKVPFKIQTDEG